MTNWVFLYQVDTAAKFVQDIIDKAKTEAARKLNSEQIVRKQQKSLKNLHRFLKLFKENYMNQQICI